MPEATDRPLPDADRLDEGFGLRRQRLRDGRRRAFEEGLAEAAQRLGFGTARGTLKVNVVVLRGEGHGEVNAREAGRPGQRHDHAFTM